MTLNAARQVVASRIAAGREIEQELLDRYLNKVRERQASILAGGNLREPKHASVASRSESLSFEKLTQLLCQLDEEIWTHEEAARFDFQVVPSQFLHIDSYTQAVERRKDVTLERIKLSKAWAQRATRAAKPVPRTGDRYYEPTAEPPVPSAIRHASDRQLVEMVGAGIINRDVIWREARRREWPRKLMMEAFG